MKEQQELFEIGDYTLHGDRDGKTYQRDFDLTRLNKQARAVWDVMAASRWLTLREISDQCGAPEASASARLRDFRKERFGSHDVERRRRVKFGVGFGLFEYRLKVCEYDPKGARRMISHAPTGSDARTATTKLTDANEGHQHGN